MTKFIWIWLKFFENLPKRKISYNFFEIIMKKLILTIILFKSFCIFGAEIYFSLHYNNLGGNPLYQGMKNEGQSINICMFDNGTTSDCVNNYPTIVNKFSDNSTNNSPLDNDTRFFEEKLNPKSELQK